MFISSKTHVGLKITVHSVIEFVKSLIMHKVSYLLSERFCWNPIENYFGKQRSSGARKFNSSHYDSGYHGTLTKTKKYSNQEQQATLMMYI